MKNLSKHRIIAVFLVVILSISAIVPVSAASFPAGFADSESAFQWDSRFDNAVAQVTTAILQPCCIALGIPLDTAPKAVMWRLFDTAVTGTGVGEVSLDRLNDICSVYNGYFNRPVRQSLFGVKDVADNFASYAFCRFMGFNGSFDFAVETHSSSGLLRICEKTTGIWVVDSKGQYPYCEGGSKAPVSGGNQWIGERSCSTAAVNMKSYDALNMICSRVKESGTPAEIRSLSTNYKAIWYNRQYYCDPEGRPFVCYANESNAAINQDRPDTSVKDENGKPAADESGTVINNPDNSTNIDLSGMTITLPNGDVQIADAVIYDESTKTYNIDSHDTTNYNITYNYSWTYHINYTSITYIGQTAEYDKKYEVYYQLPDGRDSADLTAEELEQIDYSLDVVGYGRSADDTSLRSLYHFDGDTKDSSYWNYCTGFHWYSGASLTYMDAGPFNGALYFDENEHRFYFTLPSNIGTGDFTMQFRYYQSATPTPQSDSSTIAFYPSANYSSWVWPLSFDGAHLSLRNGTSVSLSTGQWNEICIQRCNGTMYYILNGVCFGFESDPTFYYDRVWFDFWANQQTYKYLDEFRFVNKALYSGSNYTPTSVPFDTNLTLVLPDTARPVADEYWSFDKTITPVDSYDLTNFNSLNPFTHPTAPEAPMGQDVNGVHIRGSTNQSYCQFPVSYPTLKDDVYTFSIVDDSGNVYSISSPFDVYDSKTVEFPWGRLQSHHFGPEGVKPSRIVCNILPNIDTTINLVYAEVVKGSTPNTGHKYVTAIVPVTNYDKPTLAVRTDLTITGKQIGGPRPSLPTKGLVWGMVESGVIRSLQIYNGQAWEACDGRIFTGTRWIPYGSYNILTMKDFYDVVDASGADFDYIYTESGFWNWWQRTWNAFTTKLFAKLDSLGSGASDGATSDASPVVPDVDITVVQNESKDSTNFLVKVLYKLFFKDAVNNVKGAAFDFAGVFGVSVADEATSSGSGSSESTSPSSSSASDSGGGTTVTLFPLMDGDSIWD